MSKSAPESCGCGLGEGGDADCEEATWHTQEEKPVWGLVLGVVTRRKVGVGELGLCAHMRARCTK